MPTFDHQAKPSYKTLPRGCRRAFKNLDTALKESKRRLTPAEKEREFRRIFGMSEPEESTVFTKSTAPHGR